MAHATEILMAPMDIVERLAARFGKLKDKIQTRRLYRQTVRELNALPDRELQDLGIARGSIRFLASMAVYGK